MSEVQICNRGASQYLGLPRVNSFSEGSPQSEQYDLHYHDTRKALLEKHHWIFASSIQALALIENDRPNEWAYKYQKPSNILGIHWVNNSQLAAALIKSNQNPDSDRENYGQTIYSNVEKASISITFDEKNTTNMPQYFRDALSAMIAAAIAMPLTESIQRANYANSEANRLVGLAIAKDEQLMNPIQLAQNNYLDARMGGGATLNHWRG